MAKGEPKRFFRVRGWERYQESHQKNREGAMPWFKFPTSFFDDAGEANIPDSQRFCWVAVLVMAAKRSNRVPFDAEWIRRRCELKRKPDLLLFMAEGLIEFDDVVTTAAERRDDVQEERRGEERRIVRSSARASDDADPPPKTPHETSPPVAIQRHAVPSELDALRAMIRGELDALNRGEGIPPDEGLTWATLTPDGSALRDLHALEVCVSLPWLRVALSKLEKRRTARLVAPARGTPRREPTAAERTVSATEAVIAKARRGVA